MAVVGVWVAWGFLSQAWICPPGQAGRPGLAAPFQIALDLFTRVRRAPCVAVRLWQGYRGGYGARENGREDQVGKKGPKGGLGKWALAASLICSMGQHKPRIHPTHPKHQSTSQKDTAHKSPRFFYRRIRFAFPLSYTSYINQKGLAFDLPYPNPSTHPPTHRKKLTAPAPPRHCPPNQSPRCPSPSDPPLHSPTPSPILLLLLTLLPTTLRLLLATLLLPPPPHSPPTLQPLPPPSTAPLTLSM